MRHLQVLSGHVRRRMPGKGRLLLSRARRLGIVEGLRQRLSRSGPPGQFVSCRRPAVADTESTLTASPAKANGRGREEGPGIMRKEARAVFLAALAAAWLALLPAKEAGAHLVRGTVWVASGVITSSDPSACTVRAASPARGTRVMNERGPYALARRVDNAWLFDARCDGGANSFKIQVHEDFTEAEAARAAQEYGKAAGRLPKVLRSGIGAATGIRIVSIHKGSHSWFAGNRLGEIGIYTELAQDKWNEEIMVHEAAHVSLDNRVISDSKWKAAQKADGKYISGHAQNYPQQEDVAESFLAYLAARYLPSRIGKSWETTILQTIPNRIAYFDALLSAGDMKPFVSTAPRVARGEVAADNPVTLSVSGNGAISEGDAALTVTATLGTANATGAALAIPVRVRKAGTTATAGDDYTLAGTISIADGASSGTTAFAVVDDSEDEPDETVVVELGSPLPAGLAAGKTDHVTIAISDNDNPVSLSVSANGAISEGDAALTITATLGRANAAGAALAIPVRVRKAGTTATAGDYTLASTISIADGASSGTTAFAVVDDNESEPGETVVVELGSPLPAGLAAGETDHVTIAISDNDNPVTLSVSANGAISEGDAALTVTATLGTANATGAALAIPVQVRAAGTTATAGDDYTLADTISIPDGASSGTTAFAVVDDDEGEPNETVVVELGSPLPAGLAAGATDHVTITIADNDEETVEEVTAQAAELGTPAVTVALAAERASVAEDNGEVKFTVTLSRALEAGETAVVPFTVTGGKAHRDWSLRFRGADNGPGVKRTDTGHNSAVTFTEGGRAATLVLIARPNHDLEERVIAIAFGTGERAPGATGLAGGIAPVGGALSVAIVDDDAAAGPALWVKDERARESAGAMRFTVRLTKPAAEVVRVRARTRNERPVSARAGQDYEPARVDLRFRPGETKKHVRVALLDDVHDEDRETFELVLSKAEGAVIADGVAVGTIVNDDPLPGAWLARFGRTVAEQALDGIAARMATARVSGLQGAIAGQALDFSGDADSSGSSGSPAFAGAGSSGASFGGETQAQAWGMTMQDILRGSSFSLTGEADSSGGTLAFWGGTPGAGGLVSGSQFAGNQRGDGTAVHLSGETSAALLGTDYAQGPWLVGFALSQSRAEGSYAAIGGDVEARAVDGEVEASLTATIPYAALAVSERLKLWGAAGHGSGDVTVKTGLGESLSADTAWSMAAAGLRGELLAPASDETGRTSGPSLALVSDALWVRTSSEKTRGLGASESDASRLRLGLEGSWGLALAGGGAITPNLELGARHDGGDAETGFGVELGGGLAWRDPGLGLTLDLSGRMLVAHDDGGLEDRGVSAQLSFDPEPASGRGLSFGLGQDWGGQASGGLDALFAPEPLEDREGSTETAARWSMEAAWGFPAFDGRFTGSPHMGLGLATGARDYTLGWRLIPEAATAPNLSFGLRATRRESEGARPEHTVGVEFSASW